MKILLLGLQASLLLASFPPWQGPAPVKYCIDASMEQYRPEIHYALLKWFPHANLGLVETRNCQEPRTIAFRLGYCAQRLGCSFPPPPILPEPMAGDIYLNFNVPWWMMRPLLVSMLLHEVGHALGMEDSMDKMDVMEPSLMPQKWDLSEREKRLVRCLYQGVCW